MRAVCAEKADESEALAMSAMGVQMFMDVVIRFDDHPDLEKWTNAISTVHGRCPAAAAAFLHQCIASPTHEQWFHQNLDGQPDTVVSIRHEPYVTLAALPRHWYVHARR